MGCGILDFGLFFWIFSTKKEVKVDSVSFQGDSFSFSLQRFAICLPQDISGNPKDGWRIKRNRYLNSASDGHHLGGGVTLKSLTKSDTAGIQL